MDGFFGELSVRAVNSPPPSCYKDSIEQVAPAMPRSRVRCLRLRRFSL